MIWLYRPDETNTVEGFEMDDLPDHLSRLEPWFSDQPETPQISPAENATRPRS